MGQQDIAIEFKNVSKIYTQRKEFSNEQKKNAVPH